jgi:hypothetical protein
MEAISSSETSVDTQRTALHHIPVYGTFQIHVKLFLCLRRMLRMMLFSSRLLIYYNNELTLTCFGFSIKQIKLRQQNRKYFNSNMKSWNIICYKHFNMFAVLVSGDWNCKYIIRKLINIKGDRHNCIKYLSVCQNMEFLAIGIYHYQ